MPKPNIDEKNECKWLNPRYIPSSPLGACSEKYSRKRGEMNVSANPWNAIPTTIMNATGCIPSIVSASIKLPEAIISAEKGIMNIPSVILSSAVCLRMRCVTKFTVSTTISGFTLAYQAGAAPSPAIRSTYLGIVAYS